VSVLLILLSFPSRGADFEKEPINLPYSKAARCMEFHYDCLEIESSAGSREVTLLLKVMKEF
jgi:hypothetical protein